MKNKLTLLFLITLTAFSCKNKKENNTDHSEIIQENHKAIAEKENKHWTYEGETGPSHWKEIEKDSDCDGKQQSPVNIITIDAISDSLLAPIETHYSSNVKIHDITNNGHSIQYNLEKGDYITLNNEKYELKQFHFHEDSEHTIDGIRFPLEMHLVHVNKDNKIAVLGVMAKEGKSSAPFTFLEKYFPINVGQTKKIDSVFDLNENLPEDKSYYTYQGSLTTPPCSESVSWFIFKDPITISVNQVKKLQKLMPLHNYRTEQPLNGRIVKKYASSH